MHTRGRTDRSPSLAFGAGLLALLAVLVSLAVVLVTQGVKQAGTWASVLSPGVAIAGTLVTLVTWWSRQRPAAGQPARSEPLDQAMIDLAGAVRRQWTQEAAVRSLRRPEPIRIRWSSTGRLTDVLAEGVVPGRPVRLRHDVHHVVELFRKLRARQLVVLGAPGAGKTVLALLFTLGLLESLLPGEPVPVLLSASSWDPRTEHLHTWLTRRILEEYPALANPDLYGPDAVQRMVTQGRVMVVLDGLDEMPEELRPEAIAALGAAVADAHPLVVTCRSEEYEAAVDQSGTILTRAAVLKIEPVDLGDAATFLMASGPSAQKRWGPVLDHLRVHSDVPLAQALTNPLMVSLARTVYAVPASDPRELLDATRFPRQAAVEHRLLEAFIPAAYHDSPAPPGTPSTSAQHHYSPEQARRWLTFLARRFGAGDLAWWRLVDTIPRSTRGISVGFTVGLLVELFVGSMIVLAGMGIIETTHRFEGLLPGLLYGLLLGLLYGLVTGLSYVVRQRPEPVRVEMRFQGKRAPFLRRFVLGLAMGVGVGSGFGFPYGGALVVGVASGCSLATSVWLDIPAEVAKVSSPGVVLQQDRTAAFSLSLAVALLFGLIGGLVVWFPSGLAFGAIGGGGAMLVGALMGALANGTAGGLGYGRVGGRMFALLGAVAGGLVFLEPPHPGLHALALANGVISGLIAGCLGVLSRAWGAYTVSRIWLALRGEQPWQLMRFLDDAHRRGVLRQSGATYQFRHARVQDHLAHADPTNKRRSCPSHARPW